MVKYILQNSNKKWKVANTKTGRALKLFDSQQAALDFVINNYDQAEIMIEQKGKWKTFTHSQALNQNEPSKLKRINAPQKSAQKSVVDVDQMLEITSEISNTSETIQSPTALKVHSFHRESMVVILLVVVTLLITIGAIILISVLLV